MRALVALTIYVSLGSGAVFGADNSWHGLHEQGVALSGERDFQAASELFRKSWSAAKTPLERAVSANDLGVTLHQLGREADAAAWLVRALAIWKRDAGQHVHAVQTSEALAAVLFVFDPDR